MQNKIGDKERVPTAAEQPAVPTRLERQENTLSDEINQAEKQPTKIDIAKHEREVASLPELPPSDLASTPDATLVAIEEILASGMEQYFIALSHQQQVEFKQHGEEAAINIKKILDNGKFRIKDIVKLIIHWLKKLPGLNRYFLNQEAKIKADKIVQRYQSKT